MIRCMILEKIMHGNFIYNDKKECIDDTFPHEICVNVYAIDETNSCGVEKTRRCVNFFPNSPI